MESNANVLSLPRIAIEAVLLRLCWKDRMSLGGTCIHFYAALEAFTGIDSAPSCLVLAIRQDAKDHRVVYGRTQSLADGTWRRALHASAPLRTHDTPTPADAVAPAAPLHGPQPSPPPPPPYSLLPRTAHGAGGAVEYSVLFRPPPATMRATHTLVCDGRLTLLADGGGRVLSAHHPPRDAAYAAAATATAGRLVEKEVSGVDPGLGQVLGPPFRSLQTLRVLSYVSISPEAPAATHLAAATWPQPAVYRPPRPPPPPPPPLAGLPSLPSEALSAELATAAATTSAGTGGSYPSDASSLACTALGRPAGGYSRGERDCDCRACGGSLDRVGLCELGCDGAVVALPAHPASPQCSLRTAELLGSLVTQPAARPVPVPADPRTPPGQGPPHLPVPALHPLRRLTSPSPPTSAVAEPRDRLPAAEGHPPTGAGLASTPANDRDGSGDGGAANDWRLTYLDCSYHGMYDIEADSPLRAAAAAAACAQLNEEAFADAAAAAASAAAAPMSAATASARGPVSPLSLMLLSGHGAHLRHLLAVRSAAVGCRELRMLGLGDCCRRLATLDLSGCPVAAAAATAHDASFTPAAGAAAAAGAASSRTHSPPAALLASAGVGAHDPRVGRRRAAGRRGPGAETAVVSEGPSAAVLEFGRELRGAVARLAALQVLRLRDLDLRGFFTSAGHRPSSGPGPGPPHPPKALYDNSSDARNTNDTVADAGAGADDGAADKGLPGDWKGADGGRGPGGDGVCGVGCGVGGEDRGRRSMEDIDRERTGAGAGDTGGRGQNGGGGGSGKSIGAGASGGGDDPGWLRPLGCTLVRLRHLDLEGSNGVGPAQLAAILRVATRLTHLGVARCRGLSYDSGSIVSYNGSGTGATITTTAVAAAAGATDPQRCLRSLSVGWGFSAAAVRHMCAASAPYVTSLELGVGAGVDDAGLAAAAAACPHLQDLRLALCAVSAVGLGAVLAVCAKVHVLHVQDCVGPFGREALLGPLGWLPAPGATTRARGGQGATSSAEGAEGLVDAAAAAGAPAGGGDGVYVRRWAMSDLRLVGGPMELYDDDVLSLMYGMPMYGVAHTVPCSSSRSGGGTGDKGVGNGSSSSSTRSASGATGSEGASCAPVDEHKPMEESSPGPNLSYSPSRRLRHLQTLALVGLPHLSDAFLRHLQSHCTAVRHVRLEGCGHQPRLAAQHSSGRAEHVAPRADGTTRGGAPEGCCGVMRDDGDGTSAVEGPAPFTGRSLLGWLERCDHLVNLRLRHCCQLGPDVVARLTAACPSLEILMLDGCDLPPSGFKADPSPYSALSYAMVARCKADSVRLPPAAGNSGADQRGAEAGGSGSGSGSGCDGGGVNGRGLGLPPAPALPAGTCSGGGGGDGDVCSGPRPQGGAGTWWLPLERDVKIVRFCDGAVTKVSMFKLVA